MAAHRSIAGSMHDVADFKQHSLSLAGTLAYDNLDTPCE